MDIPNSATRNPLIRYAIGVLPNRTKRLTFLASITAIAKNTQEPDHELVHKLNKLFELSATGDTALMFPILISKMIWSNRIVFDKELTDLINSKEPCQRTLASATKVVDSTPKWFWYADKETIISDVLELFCGKNDIFPNAV